MILEQRVKYLYIVHIVLRMLGLFMLSIITMEVILVVYYVGIFVLFLIIICKY